MSEINNILKIAVAGLLLLSCGQNKHPENLAEETPGQNDDFRYTAIVVKDAQPVREINLPGELESFYETDLFPRVSSYISKMHVDIGDRVNKGQLLAELEAPELIANLTAAYSKVKQPKQATSRAVRSTIVRSKRKKRREPFPRWMSKPIGRSLSPTA